MRTKTVTLKQWDEASTEQRNAWLKAGVMVRRQDWAALEARAFPRALPREEDKGFRMLLGQS